MTEGSPGLIQFKLRPEVITAENVHTAVFMSSMVDSPLDSLYYMIKSVFSPALKDSNNKLNTSNNQQIHSSLTELEQILRSVGSKTNSATSIGNIFHPKDEINYWTEIARSTSNKSKDIERATYFLELLEPVKKEFQSLEK